MAIVKNRVAEPRRILAIKFSSIGDIVLTTSPLLSLSNEFPNAKIDLITSREFAPLIEGLKFINNIFPFDRDAGLFKVLSTGKWINKSNYDMIIDFHNSLRSKIIRTQINNTPKYVLKKPRWKRFLLFRFKKNTFKKDFNQIRLLHSPISHLIKEHIFPLPQLYISTEERNNAKKILLRRKVKNDYIAVIPGSAWPQKNWFIDRYHQLFTQLRNISNFDFVILGSNNDDICTEMSKLDNNYINLAGKTNIRESMAIITNSRFAIGSDTGFVHAAEALGKDVVMILGPTSRETGAGANRSTSTNIENNDISCRPCSQNGSRTCYRSEQFCMTTITPESIISKIEGLLN